MVAAPSAPRKAPRANNIMVVDQAAGAGTVRRRRTRRTSIRKTTNRSRRTASRGIHQGAAIVFFAYIGFDAISTAAEETRDPNRNLPIGILGGLAICTLIYVVIGARAHRHRAVPAAGRRRSPRARAGACGLPDGGMDRGPWCRRLDVCCAARLSVRTAADLLCHGT